MEIPKLTLNNSVTVPILGLGTWQLSGEDCINSVKNALLFGYGHIDTAEIYGNESEIGKAVKESGIKREDLFITSKFWSVDNNLGHEKNTRNYQDVIDSCEGSLKRLQTDYLDLYLIHWPNKNMDLSEVLKALKHLQDTRKIKSVGVSNFTIHHLKETLEIADKLGLKIVTNQVEFHPFLYQKKLLDFCQKNKIIITAYSPIARGKVFEDETLIKIAEKYDKSPAQISLRWLIQKNMIVIPKATSKEHLKENMDLFDFTLEDDDVGLIDNLDINSRLIEPGFSEFD